MHAFPSSFSSSEPESLRMTPSTLCGRGRHRFGGLIPRLRPLQPPSPRLGRGTGRSPILPSPGAPPPPPGTSTPSSQDKVDPSPGNFNLCNRHHFWFRSPAPHAWFCLCASLFFAQLFLSFVFVYPGTRAQRGYPLPGYPGRPRVRSAWPAL